MPKLMKPDEMQLYIIDLEDKIDNVDRRTMILEEESELIKKHLEADVVLFAQLDKKVAKILTEITSIKKNGTKRKTD